MIVTDAGPTTAEIVAWYYERRKSQPMQAWIQRALEVRDMYNGDVVVPLPEMERDEKPAVANLLSQGVDQTGMRIASTQPSAKFPTLGVPGSKPEARAANQRRQVTSSWERMNGLKLKDRRQSRQLITYGAMATIIRPDFQRKIPEWVVRDPLTTYASECPNPDDMTPDNAIFLYHRPLGWIKANYPQAAESISRRRSNNYQKENLDELFQLLEYVDGEVTVIILLGKHKGYAGDPTIDGAQTFEIVRTPNLSGICPAVTPGRITLDRKGGQFDGMVGMFQQQALLQALSVIATEKGIFKDEWIVSRQNEVAKIITPADGRMGEVGILSGGDIKEVNLDPSYMAPQMINTLERAQRLQGGIPAQMSGEGASNIRTGKASELTMSAVVDFPVQEAQEILAMSREACIKRAIAIDKNYWRNSQKSFYVQWNGKSENVDYEPGKLWKTDEVYVSYSHAGTDINGLTILVGQLTGMGLISKRYAMETHPLVEDPERMMDEIKKEGLEEAILASIQQQAAQPGSNVADFAQIMKYVISDQYELAEAVIQVQKEAQERQASVDAEGVPTAVDPLSPEAQPGLAAPGMGAEAGAAIAEPPSSITNMAALFGQLAKPGAVSGPSAAA
jgi:hypothetical protein